MRKIWFFSEKVTSLQLIAHFLTASGDTSQLVYPAGTKACLI
jgi:hypothetical protein